MNIKDEYFERIVYQKGAVEKLSSLLEDEKSYNKVMFISSKTSYQKFGAFVVNQISMAGREFVFELIDSTADFSQAIKTAEKNKKIDFVVSLGSGTVLDFGKIVANELNSKLILLPTTVTTTAGFSSGSYLSNGQVIKKIECPWAHKILVDEDFVKQERQNNVKTGVEYILSFWDLVFNYEIQNLLFFDKKDVSFLKSLLAKLNDLYVQSKEIDPLFVMDILVDLGYFLRQVEDKDKTAFCLALLLKNSNSIKNVSFGKLCLVASQMLQASYEKYFSFKKLDVNYFIDFTAISVALTELKIDPKTIDFSGVKKLRTNSQFFLKLYAVRQQVLSYIEKTKEKLSLTQGIKTKTFYDIKKCMQAFSVLPYVYDCMDFTNVLFSSGLIVC